MCGESMELTTRQSKVIAYIREFHCRHGRAPTIREICEQFKYCSLNAPKAHIDALAKKGMVVRDGGGAHNIGLVGPPLVLRDGEQILIAGHRLTRRQALELADALAMEAGK